MIALDGALRRLTVCQLTGESRGNGGVLRPRVWLRLRAAAGGNWTPDGILQLEGEANFSLSWGTTAPQSPPGWPELSKVGDVHYSTILIFNPDFASTLILLVLIHFADLLRRIAMNGIAR